MAMNPDSNKMEFIVEPLSCDRAVAPDRLSMGLVRPNGEPVPEHWSTYTVGEELTIKGYRWLVAHIGEKHLLLEPVGPVLVGERGDQCKL